MKQYFSYGSEEISYLKKKDKRLSRVIDEIGIVHREIIPDLFTALVFSIIGQQISSKAQATIWKRVCLKFKDITPKEIALLTFEEWHELGVPQKKATYIQEAAHKIHTGELDIEALYDMDDKAVCDQLSQLQGVGRWSAEMLLIFSMQRPNILSYTDLAIQRGLRMLYHHQKIDRKLFEKYRKRFSPFCTVASLYLWAVAGGAIEGMKDYKIERKISV